MSYDHITYIILLLCLVTLVTITCDLISYILAKSKERNKKTKL